jgi:hypothetical protein
MIRARMRCGLSITNYVGSGDDLEDLRDGVKDIGGYYKEIDYAFERIAAIEKHLGIERTQVA